MNVLLLILFLWGIIGFLHHWRTVQTVKKYFWEKYLEKDVFNILDIGYLFIGVFIGPIAFFLPQPTFLPKNIQRVWYFKRSK